MDLPLPVSVRSPFVLHAPATQTAPVVFVSAHSGSDYPAAFLASSRLDAAGLRRSEDCYVDALFADAPAHGVPLLAATFPRAFCDANREKWELDPAMFDAPLPPWVNTASARVGAGLGTLARVVASGESIYRSKLPFAEAVTRVETCWQPFHDMLQLLIESTCRRFGTCLVIDCHSMPGGGGGGGRMPAAQVVLGDAHGTACAASATRYVEQRFAAQGYVVRRNDPYAGGYITRHYGRPREGVHVLQVELARGLYMDETTLQRGPGFGRLRAQAAALARGIANEATVLLAAEGNAYGKKNGGTRRRRQV